MVRALVIFLLMTLGISAQETGPLQLALEKQAQLKSVVVKFRQTKKVPALTEAIVTRGSLWLIPGKAFRWELGSPAKKTIVFNGAEVFVLDEVKKSGERLSPNDRKMKPLFLTLGMGEDASFDGLMKHFKVGAATQGKGRYAANLIPESRRLRRVMKTLLMQVNLKTSFLERVGWTQRDGTEVMTEFFTPTLNGKLPASTFQIDEGAYQWKS